MQVEISTFAPGEGMTKYFYKDPGIQKSKTDQNGLRDLKKSARVIKHICGHKSILVVCM